ncbi:UNVERIFIED_CONTAM: hypothetical protein HDU68_007977 [Siphonaria sp. JEL0065]|nr:hypothetical protein HDU68_007977 [Siphonaria sp. JEL0065]
MDQASVDLVDDNRWLLDPARALAVMKQLLEPSTHSHPFQPSVQGNRALHWTVTHNQLQVLKAIAEDPRFSATNEEWCTAFFRSIYLGHADILEYLLAVQQISVSYQYYNIGIQVAVGKYSVEIIKSLLEHSQDLTGSEIGAICNISLCQAVDRGNVDMVRVLLEDSRVDPNTRTNYPLRIAKEKGHVAIVELLQQDSRVNWEV